MPRKRLAAAQSVADRLFAFEEALDGALALGSDLSSRIVTARIEARISAVMGQDAIDSVMRTLSALAGARRELVGTHHHLKSFADDIGLQESAWGDLVKPPKPQAAQDRHLKAVA